MRRYPLITTLVALAAVQAALAADPVFENQTPVGYNPEDSTTVQDFVSGSSISVRVDLNQAATDEYPVIGNFFAVERSEQLSTTNTDGMSIDIAMLEKAPFGVTADTTSVPKIHVAYIEESASLTGPVFTGGGTAAYEIFYTSSTDGGDTFSTPVSISGSISYYATSTDASGGAFSSLDLEVDSGGNPRVAYAFITTADHSGYGNIYFGHSQDGGQTWETPLVINDVTTVGNRQGRRTAFPRMAIDDRDQIFITYVRGTSDGSAGTDDIMLAKIDQFSGTLAAVGVGSLGTIGSTGGVRLSVDTDRQTGPDVAIGDGDALHVLYFSDPDEGIQHKRGATDTTWIDVSTSGWSQGVDGSTVASFDDESADNAAAEEDVGGYFPTVVVDRNRAPDRVYAVYKAGDATTESISFNQYNDDGSVGASATWGTTQPVWSNGGTPMFDDGASEYTVEDDWTITERVSAVVDDRLDDRGDLHIAFTADFEGVGEHDVYYGRYNGTSWTLPQNVADNDSDGTGTEDGIANADTYLLSPALAENADVDHLYLVFAGGTGEGFGVGGVTDVDHHPYSKVLGRAITSEDESRPVGAYEYTLTYTPTNPQTPGTEIADRAVYAHVADPTDGSGLGADGTTKDAFLAGSWERVGTSLQDTQKRFEGQTDDSANDDVEWGDNDDKVGLLVKLNVLGSDSSDNLQLVTNSSADERSLAVGSLFTTLPVGSYFALGADIDIVASNSAPTVAVSDPDGTGDEANTSYTIRYDLNDADDDLSGNLDAALYAYPSDGLQTVQDIRIFATLIADENDVIARNANGTDDLTEGTNQTYTWDDPGDSLEVQLFASILKVTSGTYYIYLVAEDDDNPPVFAVSSGPLTLVHHPVVQSVDPIVADTVDTGVRTGLKANPYDLDFSVVDYDSQARIQLFYASVSGITSVSATGKFPNESFVLGKSVSGTRGTAITDSTDLTTADTEYSWDVTSPLITQGAYYLYAVATDGDSVVVGDSAERLVVAHSPSFTFYEPARNTQRNIDSGSQPIYTIQWQKGPGDGDLDDDANISLYFTTVDPATTNYAGSDSTNLTSGGGGNAQLIAGSISENAEAASDMYEWDLRTTANVPLSDQRV